MNVIERKQQPKAPVWTWGFVASRNKLFGSERMRIVEQGDEAGW
jgi:hypothetical protein